MKAHKRILKTIAKNNRLDSDELLVTLWGYYPEKTDRFNYLENENSVVRSKDMVIVKEIIDTKRRKKNLGTKVVKKQEPVRIIYREHDFSLVGKTVETLKYITREEILTIYNELVTDFSGLEDPISPSGVKEENLLDSALFHAETAYEGKLKYPTVHSVAAAMMYSISHNHPFHNGNKRTAIVAMLIFLDRHNFSLTCSEDDLFKISLDLAGHKLVEEKYRYPDSEIYALASWIKGNSRVITRGERVVTLKKLKQILNFHNCQILDNGKVTRRVNRSPLLSVFGTKTLTSNRAIEDTISDGNEVDKGLIKSIREDLALTTDNGIDSETFYSGAEFSSSEFIIKYKTLLRRLSKV